MKFPRVIAVALSMVGSLSHAATAELHYVCAEGDRSNLESPTIRVMTLNISHGRKTALNQMLVSKEQTIENLAEIADLVNRSEVDVLALQEADAPSRWSGGFDHVEHLASQTGFPCLVHGRHSRSWVSDYGTALLSTVTPRTTESIAFKPTPPTKQKGFVAAQFPWRTGDEEITVTVTSVHLDFLRKKNRDSQITEMVDYLTAIDGPKIVLGDFNSEWSDEGSGVRRLAEALDLHAHEPAAEKLGTYKGVDGKRLDWILLSAELEFADYEVLPDVVSDHLAVSAAVRKANINKKSDAPTP